MEPASPSAYVSASLSLSLCVTIMNNKNFKEKKKNQSEWNTANREEFQNQIKIIIRNNLDITSMHLKIVKKMITM